jgi:hypothetical protein
VSGKDSRLWWVVGSRASRWVAARPVLADITSPGRARPGTAWEDSGKAGTPSQARGPHRPPLSSPAGPGAAWNVRKRRSTCSTWRVQSGGSLAEGQAPGRVSPGLAGVAGTCMGPCVGCGSPTSRPRPDTRAQHEHSRGPVQAEMYLRAWTGPLLCSGNSQVTGRVHEPEPLFRRL